MEKFIPRCQPPQPKPLNIEPPKHAVPDVTLMFDSDDSLIWKPGESIRLLEQQKSNEEKFPPIFVSTNSKPCITESQNSQERPKILEVLTPTITKKSSSSSNSLTYKGYNPSIYASPKTGGSSKQACVLLPQAQCPLQASQQSTQHIAYHSDFSKNQNEETCMQSPINDAQQIDKPVKVSRDKRVGFKHHTNDALQSSTSQKKPNSLPKENIPPHYSQAKENRPVLSTFKTPSNTQSYTNAGFSHDPHILKLIEGQNQQILYLHKVLENFLDKPSQNERDSKSKDCCRHCSCDEVENNKPKQKIAITQTDFPERVPETNSVGTNTDLSWDEMVASLKSSTKGKKLVPAKDVLNDGKITLANDAQKDVSLTLKDVAMDTIYDPVSPEQSIHVNVPEYQHENFTTVEQCINEYEEKSQSTSDSPCVGESASIYNERIRRNEDEEDGSSQDNRMTYINNVMICLQQYLQKGDENDQYDDGPRTCTMQTPDGGKKAFLSHQQREFHAQDSVNPQLKQFGISVLETKTAVNKHRTPLPDLDSHLPLYLQRGCNISDLEMLDKHFPERRKPDSKALDAQLAAIARLAPNRVLGAKPNIRHIQQPQNENLFSFATEEFLGKYELDK